MKDKEQELFDKLRRVPFNVALRSDPSQSHNYSAILLYVAEAGIAHACVDDAKAEIFTDYLNGTGWTTDEFIREARRRSTIFQVRYGHLVDADFNEIKEKKE